MSRDSHSPPSLPIHLSVYLSSSVHTHLGLSPWWQHGPGQVGPDIHPTSLAPLSNNSCKTTGWFLLVQLEALAHLLQPIPMAERILHFHPPGMGTPPRVGGRRWGQPHPSHQMSPQLVWLENSTGRGDGRRGKVTKGRDQDKKRPRLQIPFIIFKGTTWLLFLRLLVLNYFLSQHK